MRMRQQPQIELLHGVVGRSHDEVRSLPSVSELALVFGESVFRRCCASSLDLKDGGVSEARSNKVSKASVDSRRVINAPPTRAKVISDLGVVSVDFGGTSHRLRRRLPLTTSKPARTLARV